MDADEAIEEIINVLNEADLVFVCIVYKQVCHPNVKIIDDRIIKLGE